MYIDTEIVTETTVRKDYIKRSFSRCKFYGLMPSLVYSRRIIEGIELAKRLEGKHDLIVIAEPFVRQLCDFLKGTSFFSILTDEEGCILRVIGDDDILEDAFALRMIPGAFMDERNIGTNAMGTALAEKCPVQVSGDEHFIRAYHRWTCSGAPIRNSQGEIIGSLDLTGNSANVHQHTLGMVVAAVNAIEKNLELVKNNEQLKHNHLFTEKLMDSIQAGIVSCNLKGDILTINSQASELLGVEKTNFLSKSICSYIPDWKEIQKAAIAGEDFQNMDVLLNARSNKLYFNISAYPILGQNREVAAIILTIKDVKRVRKHANDIIGRRAVYTFNKMIGVSPAFLEAVQFAKKVADSNSTILITGESGTGKEIFAQAIQNCSSRKSEPFVVLNCGAIPRTLIESELFGYFEGAFTGAKRGGQAGKFEIADGGTIFLDEIGEMPLDMQVKLLRVIEEGTVVRLGGANYIPVNVRIIAATNKDLRTEVAEGRFRMDLFFRLNVLPIRLPALRERKEDIPLLIDYYINKISKKLNKRKVPIGKGYMKILCNYEWPGNIRELENLIELIINTEKIPSTFHSLHLASSSMSDTLKPDTPSLEGMEASYIDRVLKEHDYNISAAAKHMKIGRNTLYRKIRNYGISCSKVDHTQV